MNTSLAVIATEQPMEDVMLKRLSLCAILAALGTSPLHAQEREAYLQAVEIPQGGFDLIVAAPVPGARVLPDLSASPEALIIHLPGSLALVFEDPQRMLEAIDLLQTPIGTFQVKDNGSGSSRPVALYIVPKAKQTASV